MAIVSSVIAEDRAQKDGRRSVREAHTDQLGNVYTVTYLAESGANAGTTMTSRVAQIDTQLVATELENDLGAIMIGDFAKVTTHYATASDVRSFLRAIYQTGQGLIIGRLAAFLLTLTDAQLRGLFSMTQGQIAGLRSRLQVKVDALAAALTATGE